MSIWEILNNKWSHLGKIKKIVEILEKIRYHNPMKLEKILINRKHEMFWNIWTVPLKRWYEKLTVNMKCFEINYNPFELQCQVLLTVNMKCFEIIKSLL